MTANEYRYQVIKSQWDKKTHDYITLDYGKGYSWDDVKDICKGYSFQGITPETKCFTVERKNTMTFFSIRKTR